jgi:hypothetical protein
VRNAGRHQDGGHQDIDEELHTFPWYVRQAARWTVRCALVSKTNDVGVGHNAQSATHFATA